MLKYKQNLLWLLLAFVVFLWFFPFANILPFDFDEALYRRAAEEMLQKKQWFQPTWDGIPFFDKPPTYMWTIMLTSLLIDNDIGVVSSLASRLPSYFFSLSIILMLGWSWQKQNNKTSFFSHMTFPGFIYSLAFFPAAGAALTLLDPMLTAFYTPIFLIFNQAFNDTSLGMRKLSLLEGFILTSCLALTTMTKGLIGFLLPGFTIFIIIIIELFTNSKETYKFIIINYFSLWRYFVISIFISACFYGIIWFSGAKEFVWEFFITHHFHRGSTALEGHSGTIFYYPLVLILGGIGIFTIIWQRILTCGWCTFRKRQYVVTLAWLVAFVSFFTLMATKLPNYTWPMWPAITWLACLLITEFNQNKSVGILKIIPAFLLIVLGVIFIFIPIFLITLPFPIDARAKILIQLAGEPTISVWLGCFLAGFSCFYLAYLSFLWIHPSLKILLQSVGASSLFLASIAFGVLPFANNAFAIPIQKAINYTLKKNIPVHVVGLVSPAASSAYRATAGISRYSWDNKEAFQGDFWIIIPDWYKEHCHKNKYYIEKSFTFIHICRANF